jgi:hypothetical protein
MHRTRRHVTILVQRSQHLVEVIAKIEHRHDASNLTNATSAARPVTTRASRKWEGATLVDEVHFAESERRQSAADPTPSSCVGRWPQPIDRAIR